MATAGSSSAFIRTTKKSLDSEIEHAEMALFHASQEDGIQSACTNLLQLPAGIGIRSMKIFAT
jgi:hypothetical protein